MERLATWMRASLALLAGGAADDGPRDVRGGGSRAASSALRTRRPNPHLAPAVLAASLSNPALLDGALSALFLGLRGALGGLSWRPTSGLFSCVVAAFAALLTISTGFQAACGAPPPRWRAASG
jgi:hypothetical protein